MARKKATSSPPVVHRLPITQARINLGAVVKRVHLNKEYIILENSCFTNLSGILGQFR